MTICSRSSLLWGSSFKTWHRDKRGEITSNWVFSRRPDKGDDTIFNSLEQSILLWFVESMDLINEHEASLSHLPGCLGLGQSPSRTSFTPAETADNSKYWLLLWWAMILAKVVLPQPGGPQRIIENNLSALIAFAIKRSPATRWCCPKNSSRVPGRMRSARGGRVLGFSALLKRFMALKLTPMYEGISKKCFWTVKDKGSGGYLEYCFL